MVKKLYNHYDLLETIAVAMEHMLFLYSRLFRASLQS